MTDCVIVWFIEHSVVKYDKIKYVNMVLYCNFVVTVIQ